MLDKEKLLAELKRAKEGHESEGVRRWLGQQKCEGAVVVLTGLIEMIEDGYFDKEDIEEEE